MPTVNPSIYCLTVEQSGWRPRRTQVIAGQIRRYRLEQGLSAQKLADRCELLGFAVPRSVIANLENGHREGIDVAELEIIARALNVSPADLAVPLGHAATVEQLPGWDRDTWSAVLWWSGFAARPGRPDTAVKAGVVHLYQVFYQLLEDWTFASHAHRQSILTGLRGIRGDLAARGLIVPELPPDVAGAMNGSDDG